MAVLVLVVLVVMTALVLPAMAIMREEQNANAHQAFRH